MNKDIYKEKWVNYESKDDKEKEAIKARNVALLKERIRERIRERIKKRLT